MTNRDVGIGGSPWRLTSFGRNGSCQRRPRKKGHDPKEAFQCFPPCSGLVISSPYRAPISEAAGDGLFSRQRLADGKPHGADLILLRHDDLLSQPSDSFVATVAEHSDRHAD